jgi:RNA polymerase sigma-70 factor (ECF subfamily)
MASAGPSERERPQPPLRLEPATADARGEFVARHQRGLWRFARLLGAANDHADDLVQEALLAALHKQVDARPDPEAAAWLRAAVRNLWRMHLRTQRRRPEHQALDTTPELADAAMARHGGDDGSGDAFVAALRQCLETLDGRAKRALELRYAEQSSRAAMASELAMGEDGIKTLLRRTREALFACVQRRQREERQ